MKNIEVTYRPMIKGMYFLCSLSTPGTYRLEAFIRFYLYAHLFCFCIKYLVHNLYSTKLEKRSNIYFGHRLSPPGYGFEKETLYPVKIAVSIIYAHFVSTDMM